MKTSWQARNILREIQTLKRQIIPAGRLILFGSQARGDAHKNSDWDLLLIINTAAINLDDRIKYAYPFVQLGWPHDVDINVLLYAKNEWEQRKFTPLYKNIEKDGIEIN